MALLVNEGSRAHKARHDRHIYIFSRQHSQSTTFTPSSTMFKDPLPFCIAQSIFIRSISILLKFGICINCYGM